MKIICTEEEQRQLKAIIDSAPICFDDCYKHKQCDECLAEKIEWEVTDDGCGKG